MLLYELARTDLTNEKLGTCKKKSFWIVVYDPNSTQADIEKNFLSISNARDFFVCPIRICIVACFVIVCGKASWSRCVENDV